MIYAIVDTHALASADLDPIAFAEACIAARPWALQLRMKNTGVNDAHAETRERLASAIAERSRAAKVPFVVNDDADLAARVEAEMVHVGQGDEPAHAVRARYGSLRVGVSTHTLLELARALADRANLAYVAFGPVFATASKAHPEKTVGPELLRQAWALARAANVPLVAIGGLHAGNLPALRGMASAVAIIGALTSAMRDGGAAGVAARFAELRTAVGDAS